MTEETQEHNNLLRPKSGTATSSPVLTTASQFNINVENVKIWMQANAYEESTIRNRIRKLKQC